MLGKTFQHHIVLRNERSMVLTCRWKGFVRSLAKEVGRSGSTVNAVTVGPAPLDKAIVSAMSLVNYLLSDEAAFVSGQHLSPQPPPFFKPANSGSTSASAAPPAG